MAIRTSRLTAKVALALLQLTTPNNFLVLKIISANKMILGTVFSIPEVQHFIQRVKVVSILRERKDWHFRVCR